MSDLKWANRLNAIGLAIQRTIRAALSCEGECLASPVAQEGGDTIFAIDRRVESIIQSEIQGWPSDCFPLLLVAEGMGNDGKRILGNANDTPKSTVIIDPIDGTRNIMYDKRSAWFIAAVAEYQDHGSTLGQSFASVLVELPTSKQSWCDVFTAVRDHQTIGYRMNVAAGSRMPLVPRPSLASNLRNGFGQVSNFFPGTKILAAELMERIAERTVGKTGAGQALVFDDQYISTGGQMVELMVGHDRFCCDLRPLFYRILERQTGNTVRGLECHPYDVAGSLVAKNAGVIITDGFGKDLDYPMDVHTGVHWCGYANKALHDAIQPVILQWLREKGIDTQ
jgi:fructose-1,6-bisphosphatase/inositol monophosphatase family enzyme